MTKHFNRTQEKETRRKLRRNETLAEKHMWSQLRNRQLLGLKFKRQYSVDKFVIDFYCPEQKIAIELDGNVHELEDVKMNDLERQKYIETYGIKFIRIKNEEYLGNPNKVFAKLEAELKNVLNKKPLP